MNRYIQQRSISGTHYKAVCEPDVDRVHRVFEQRQMGGEFTGEKSRVDCSVDELDRAPFTARDKVHRLHGEQ